MPVTAECLSMTALLGFIPSPSSGILKLGPLGIHLYGVTLLVAILACVWLTTRRWQALGGDGDLVVRVAVWGGGFGVVGARLYHDLTSWDTVSSPKWKGIFAVWEGGLGIWGGVLFGTLAGVVVVRRAGARPLLFMEAIAPGMLLAQGIGRVGNWWNQELYGKPTSLPWGLKIDSAHVDPAYIQFHTFQPTFLYELLWNLAGVVLLLWVARRFTLRPPALFSLYVAYYCFGRFFEELLRIDKSAHLLGLRLNAWVSLVCFALAAAFFLRWQLFGRDGGTPRVSRRERKQHDRHLHPPEGPKMAIPKGRVR